ncbi:hypothetical protein ABZP36_008569 [Zizania latifolia]
MAPKKQGKGVANPRPVDPSEPTYIPGDPMITIQNQGRKLTVYTKKVHGSEAYNASLSYQEGQQEEFCVAVCRRLEQAQGLFEILTSCSHKNIAKPVGIWEEREKNIAYIVFACFDGSVNSIPKTSIFEEVESVDKDEPSTFCLSDQGCKILTDIFMTVKYVNELYGKSIPLKPLNFEESRIVYQLKAQGDYHVLLTDFQFDISPTGNKRENRRKGKASSTAVQTVDEVSIANWNGLGKFLTELHKNLKPHEELSHLSKLLGQQSVKYEDLVWEAGIWEFSTKLQFIREIYWCYDHNEARKDELKKRNALGLQSCIDELKIKESRRPDDKIIERNLYNSLFFLRVYMVAHQDVTVKGYSDTKVNVEDPKAIGRLLMKNSPKHMVNLISYIRKFGWIRESPFLRTRTYYQLGNKLSLKWSTGAGPRIGCVKAYPVQLRMQALEMVDVSPRASTPSTS